MWFKSHRLFYNTRNHVPCGSMLVEDLVSIETYFSPHHYTTPSAHRARTKLNMPLAQELSQLVQSKESPLRGDKRPLKASLCQTCKTALPFFDQDYSKTSITSLRPDQCIIPIEIIFVSQDTYRFNILRHCQSTLNTK